jgi:hypothetical protein
MTRVIPLLFQTSIKQLRVENEKHVLGNPKGRHFISHSWRIWLTANGDFTLGTFLQLCDNGTINRVTWHEDGTETVFEVTDEEA